MSIKYIVISFFIFQTIIPYSFEDPQYVMLAPMGDALKTGRSITDTFERAITYEFCLQLKQAIEDNSSLKVVISRKTNQRIGPFQNANFANRLQVNLFIHIGFFPENYVKPRVYIYHYSYDNDFVPTPNNLCFFSWDKTYIKNFKITAHMATIVKQNLEKYDKQLAVQGVFAFPFKPLVGILSPSLGIEIGLKEQNDWQDYITPLAEAIEAIVG